MVIFFLYEPLIPLIGNKKGPKILFLGPFVFCMGIILLSPPSSNPYPNYICRGKLHAILFRCCFMQPINLPNAPPLFGFEIGNYNKFAQLWANIIIFREIFKKTPMFFVVLEKDRKT